MAQVSWKQGVSGNWSDAADWSTGKVPGKGDSVLIGAAGGYTVSVTATAQAGALTITAGGAELAVSALLSVTDLVMEAGFLNLSAGGTLAESGPSVLGVTGADGPSIGGTGTFQTTGATRLAVQSGSKPDLTLGGGVHWVNGGTASIGGQIDIGNGYDQGGTITNLASGTLDLTTATAAIVQLNINDSAVLDTAGLLEKTAGGNSSIGAYVDNTGTIDAANGTLSFALGGNFAGVIEGAGSVDFTGGTSLITASVTPSVTVSGGTVDLSSGSLHAIRLAGGTLGVTGDSAISLSLALTGGAAGIAAGETLTVRGMSSFGVSGANGPYLGGTGTLATDGAVALAIQSGNADDLDIGGGVTWKNAGTVTAGGLIDVGNGYDQGGTIANLVGAVFDLATGSAAIAQLNINDVSVFDNAGLFEKTALGTSEIGATVDSTGTIDAAHGTLSFAIGGVFGGKIDGAGLVDFTGGTSLITASVTPSVAVLGGTVNLASESLSAIRVQAGILGVTGESAISGPLSMPGGSMVLATGETLTVHGATSFGTAGADGPTIAGSGTLVTDGAVVLAMQSAGADDMDIAGGATWENAGTVTAGGQIDIGNGYDQGAILVNEAGGVIKLASAAAAIIQLNINDEAILDNAGTLQTSAGSGTLSVGAYLDNTGTVDIASGMLNLKNGGALGGSVTGSGSLMFSGNTAFDPAANSIDFIDNKCTNDASVSIGYGAVTFLTSFTNNGTLSTTGGVITCTDELKGTGTIKLGGLGTVILVAGSTSTQTVDFQPSFGDLNLGVPLLYQGEISGFAAGDTIDLLLTAATDFTYSAGVLTVFDGAVPVANLHFYGSYTQTGFGITPDGHGGTVIGYT